MTSTGRIPPREQASDPPPRLAETFIPAPAPSRSLPVSQQVAGIAGLATVALVTNALWQVWGADIDVYSTFTPYLGSHEGTAYFQIFFSVLPWSDGGAELWMEWIRQSQGALLPGFRRAIRHTGPGVDFPSPQGVGLHVTLPVNGTTRTSMTFTTYLRILFSLCSALRRWKSQHHTMGMLLSPTPGAALLWNLDYQHTSSARDLIEELWNGVLDGELNLPHGTSMQLMRAAGIQMAPFNRGEFPGMLHMSWL